MNLRILIAAICATLIAAISNVFSATTANWPQFRGPNCSGVAAKAKPPVNIAPTNSLWRIEVPWSPSSPCVSGDSIFLTTYADGQLETRCYGRQKGDLRWSRPVKVEKLETFHRTEGSPAAATPATDGQRLVSYFGSFGLICYDFKGKELWQYPLPLADSGGGFGSGTSPIIAGNFVVLNRDQAQDSTLLAVDLRTGKKAWETPRREARGSFGSPIVWRNQTQDEIVTPGSIRIQGYDLKTGKERWKVEPVAAFVCTTPVSGDGLLFFAAWSPGKNDSPWPNWASFLEKNDKNKDGEVTFDEFDASNRDFARGMDFNRDGKITSADWDLIQAYTAKSENVAVAVKSGGTGDISQTHVAWKLNRGLPYVASPLFYEGRLYLVKDGGIISSLDAKTGKPCYLQERID
ncbi:MAG TPA: PQQ-binding-like beta-propeller repeat protein, partial [Verrucomicrobiae bacterium]|nr:PQQ-binding-like beta-propeller repeat protein [Verrucomicrobiae bacterium]